MPLHLNDIWMWFDLKYEYQVTLPFDNVNCGKVNRLLALEKRILRVDQKPILVFGVDQQGVCYKGHVRIKNL